MVFTSGEVLINIRSIIIIKQIQNMNLMLNMKDINKIIAKIESYVWEKNCNIFTKKTQKTQTATQLYC
jgi:formyltetrahydrofolate hydrolase